MMMLRERLKGIGVSTIRSLRLVMESSARWTILSIVLALLQGVTPILQLVLLGRMIDAVTSAAKGTGSFDNIAPLLILVAVISFINIALGSVESVAREAQVMAVGDHVAKMIHSKSIEVDLDYYENQEYHDTLHRAQQEAPSRPPMIVDNLISVAQNGILVIGVTGLLLSLNKLTPIILLGSTLPIAFIRFYYARIMYEWQKTVSQQERRANYFNLVLTAEWFAKELRLFNNGSVFVNRYMELRDRLRHGRMRLVIRRTRAELFTQFLTVVALFGAFALIIQDVLAGALSIGDLVIAFQAFQSGQSSMRSLLSGLTSLYENNLFLEDFYRFISLEHHIAPPAHPAPIPVPITRGICFEDVHFMYAQGTHEILKGVSFEIHAGEVIALVGDNGTGKTTLVKLLCRLYDPTSGRITLDGHDLREFDPIDLRRHITALFQDFNIYQLTALENVWLGNTDAQLDQEAVVAAAKQSGADEVISHLPNGYETQLGNLFESGQELSYGQWQKVALARAFLRESQLIVLDEPTSALDVITESEIFERFRQIAAGRSGILISHRLSTVRMADRILVLEDGQIVENGTHDELVALGGRYAHLYATQSQYYR